MKQKIPYQRSIRFRIMMSFILLVLVVIMLINYFSGLIFSRELLNQAEQHVDTKLHTIISDFHESITEIRATADLIQGDELVEKAVVELNDEENLITMGTLLDKYAGDNPFISKILFMDTSFELLDKSNETREFNEMIMQDETFINFVNSSNLEDFSSTLPEIQNENASEDFWGSSQWVNYYRKLYDENYDRVGYLILLVNADVLFENTEVHGKEVFSEAFIASENDDMIYNLTGIPDKLFHQCTRVLFGEDDMSIVTEIDGEKVVYFRDQLGYNTEWDIAGYLSYEDLMENVGVMRFAIYIIGLICIVGVVLISILISNSLTNPIVKINRSIAVLEQGEWPEAIELNHQDELSLLGEGVNRMVVNMKWQFDKIIQEEDEKKAAELKALKLEMDLLQSQINPHFIHNTLNTFSYFALMNKDMRLRELIQSFNALLRASMSIKNTKVTIKTELELMDKYIEILRSRYDDIFTYSCHVPDHVLEFCMPKLILQPLVENALFHGIVPKGAHGTIQVKIVEEAERLQISVLDDGVGIDPDRLISNHGIVEKKQTRGFNNIGIGNVNDRLKLMYGEGYSLDISSEVDRGTTVTFAIPIEKDRRE